MLVVPCTWEAKAGRLMSLEDKEHSGQHGKTPSQS